ncbi:MAG: hypothetical protein H7840_07155 [Alphaproteobacteria bacterium]
MTSHSRFLNYYHVFGSIGQMFGRSGDGVRLDERGRLLVEAIDLLQVLSRRLVFLGVASTVVTLINLVATVVSLSIALGGDFGLYRPVFILQAIITGVVAMLLWKFHFVRNAANKVFEEVSNGFQPYYAMGRNLPEFEELDRTSSAAVRGFFDSTDLPLFHGKAGPGVYFLVNFFLAFLPLEMMTFLPLALVR